MSDPLPPDRRRKQPLALKPGRAHWIAFAIIVVVLMTAWWIWHR
jgi:hypothetical protein